MADETVRQELMRRLEVGEQDITDSPDLFTLVAQRRDALPNDFLLHLFSRMAVKILRAPSVFVTPPSQ